MKSNVIALSKVMPKEIKEIEKFVAESIEYLTKHTKLHYDEVTTYLIEEAIMVELTTEIDDVLDNNLILEEITKILKKGASVIREYSSFFKKYFMLPDIEKTINEIIEIYKLNNENLTEIYYQNLDVFKKTYDIYLLFFKEFEKINGEDKKNIAKMLKEVDEYGITLIDRLKISIYSLKSLFDKLMVKYSNLYGFYTKNNNKIDEILKQFKQSDSNKNKNGAVFICIDTIKKDFGKKYLKRTRATVLHEHAHAICYTGKDSSGKTFINSHSRNMVYKVISEAIAEWTELDCFRSNKEIFNIVLDHARSGNVPYWPYAGALGIENKDKPKTFEKVLDDFRNNKDPKDIYMFLFPDSKLILPDDKIFSNIFIPSHNTSGNENGDTPLIRACREGNIAEVKSLIKNNADVNEKNNDGDTPLIVACANGRMEVVHFLLLCNADALAKNNKGMTATDVAGDKKIKDLIATWLAESEI